MIESVNLKVRGMTCTLCSASIEVCLERLNGVKKADVSYAAESAAVDYDAELLRPDEIEKAIVRLGFEVGKNEEEDEWEHGGREALRQLRLFILSALLTAPTLICMVSCAADICDRVVLPDGNPGTLNYIMYALHDWRVQFLFATPVQFIIGAGFYRRAIKSVMCRRPTMDLLVVLGSSAAYLYSVYIVAFHRAAYDVCIQNIYLDASATIITFVLLGKYLETLAKGRMAKSIRTLTALKPKTARVLRDGQDTYIPVEELQEGDIVIVRPGEQVPADGVVTEGCSTVDESMLTGESLPKEKYADCPVTAASLNKNGTFRFRAEKIGDRTLFAGIVRYVEQAQSSKAAVQRAADRAAGYFVPLVLLASVITFIVWYFIIFHCRTLEQPLIYAVSVLVVSCPCALGLATPAAIIVSIGKGAENGILIKNGEVLEDMCKIDTVVFDKTGTITEGKPELMETVLLEGKEKHTDEKEILRIASIAEKNSEHPLGRALYQKGFEIFGTVLPEPERFEALPGMGVAAVVGSRHVLIGSPGCLSSRGIEVPEARETLEALKRKGRTTVLMAVDGIPVSIFGFSDRVRESAPDAAAGLERMDIEVYMLTGDNLSAAQEAAEKTGIKNILAQVGPGGKADEIKKLQSRGRKVAMVGDGINDAPALAVSDIGVAVGSGTDVAIETGGVILLKSDLTALPHAVRLARKTILKITQNLFWAFFYNSIAIPFAASGHLSPAVGALSMAFSSVSVLLNSLSLRRLKL